MTFRYDTFGSATFPILVSLPLHNGLEVVIRVGDGLIAESDGPWPSVFARHCGERGFEMRDGVFTEHKLAPVFSLSDSSRPHWNDTT
jgi:hypothetical protein